MFVYILQLEEGKYYVGKTEDPEYRIETHFASNGSAWTKKYKPLSVVEIVPDCDNYDEEKHTLKCMEKYGINNVRGGSFCQIRLSDENINTLQQIINGVNDRCYMCGSDQHFANKCRILKKKNKMCQCPTSYFAPHRKIKCFLNKVLDSIESLFEDEDDDIEKINETFKTCFRCGRTGHFVKKCYATTHINGKRIYENKYSLK